MLPNVTSFLVMGLCFEGRNLIKKKREGGLQPSIIHHRSLPARSDELLWLAVSMEKLSKASRVLIMLLQ